MNKTDYRFLQREKQIMKGSNEGIDGWISLNYLLKTLMDSSTSTIGALEISSTSAQITFAVNSTEFKDLRSGGTLVDFKDGSQWHLYTHSYPTHGIDTMEDMIQNLVREAAVMKEGPKVKTFAYPCWPVEYNRTIVYPDNFELLLFGTSLYAECKSYVDRVINISSCGSARCGPGKVYQPDYLARGKFYGFSVYNYATTYFGYAPDATIELTDFLVKTQKQCAMSMTDMVSAHSATKKDLLVRYCYYGTYIHTLLSEGFGLQNFSSAESINGVRVGWAPGAMMYEAMHIADNFTYCGDYNDCTTCLFDLNCGFCEDTSFCVPGDAEGAYGVCTAGWQKLEAGGFCRTGDTPVRFVIAVVFGAAVVQVLLVVGFVIIYRRWNAGQLREITHMPLLE